MQNPKIAVFCAGGPAPGFDAVIHGLTVEFTKAGCPVIGLRDGLKYVMEGKLVARTLTPDDTFQTLQKGGSIIGVSRANPTKDPLKLRTVVQTLREAGVGVLVSIGGDDTAKTARAIAKESLAEGQGAIRVIHVPKTIDNDLPVGDGLNTFGYISAVHNATRIINTLLEDSNTTGDRHFVRIIMGRTAGWLAVGAAQQTNCAVFLPEEFKGQGYKLKTLADLIIGSVIKAEALVLSSEDKLWAPRGAVHIVAEGVFEEFSDFEDSVRSMFPTQGDLFDEHNHLRFSRIHLQTMLDILLASRLEELGLNKTLKKARGSISLIVDKLGFELRCVDPTDEDRQYAQELGSHAALFALNGDSNVMVVPTTSGQYNKLPFEAMVGPDGKTIVRKVPLNHIPYQQLLDRRLLPEDLQKDSALASAISLLTAENPTTLSALRCAACISALHKVS